MRKSILVLYCTLTASCFAQNHIADSLRQLIAQSKEDSSRLTLLKAIGHAYLYSHPDSCYYYTDLELQLAKKIHNQKDQTFCLTLLGTTLSYIGNYPKALHLSLESLQLAENIGDRAAICDAYNSLGTNYYFQKDFEKSLEYFIKAWEFAQNLHDELRITLSLGNVGGNYIKLNKLDSALYYMKMAYQKSIAIKDTEGIPYELTHLADIYLGQNKNSTALQYYQLALPAELAMADNDDICETTLRIAGIFKKQNLIDSALIYSYQSMQTAISSNFNARQMEASNFIASLYESRKDPDSAFKYLKLTLTLKDSLFSQEKSKTIQNMTFEENIRQQELVEQKKAAEENAKKNLQLIAIAVFIPIFFLFVVFLSRIKVKARLVEFFAVVGLLLSFEFINDLIYPYISDLTNDSPLWETLILVIIAALIEPINYRLEHWVKTKLVHKAAL
jgi:tetratricopeptide (TPR) repeat protein